MIQLFHRLGQHYIHTHYEKMWGVLGLLDVGMQDITLQNINTLANIHSFIQYSV